MVLVEELLELGIALLSHLISWLAVAATILILPELSTNKMSNRTPQFYFKLPKLPMLNKKTEAAIKVFQTSSIPQAQIIPQAKETLVARMNSTPE
jgi:hypothetical protein